MAGREEWEENVASKERGVARGTKDFGDARQTECGLRERKVSNTL